MNYLRYQKHKNKLLKNITLELQNGFKPIAIFTNDTDNTQNWYDLLLNYIPEPI